MRFKKTEYVCDCCGKVFSDPNSFVDRITFINDESKTVSLGLSFLGLSGNPIIQDICKTCMTDFLTCFKFEYKHKED